MNQVTPLRQGSYTRTNGAPSAEVWPRFHIEAVQDMLASERAGRPIFRDEERVEINMPGNPYSKPVMMVKDEHRQRWPEEYKRFKAGMDVAVSGTPLEQLPALKPSMIRELKALDFQTVEQLAAMNDHAIQRIPMYGRRLKEIAAVYLDDAERIAVVTAAQAQKDRDAAEIATLRLQVENLQTSMAQMHSQFMAHFGAPNPLMTAIPGATDPVEIAKFARTAGEEPAQSSFADLPAPAPRRGRPPKEPSAA